MKIPPKKFLEKTKELSEIHFPDAKIQIREYSKFRLKLRLVFSVDFFVEVFYAPQTSRTSFAMINDEKRIFGIDNLGGWHRHPLEDPAKHITISKPNMDEIFNSLRNAKDKNIA